MLRHASCRLTLLLTILLGAPTMTISMNFVPANDPYIQYFGRWDTSDPLHPRFSWPGVYIVAEFGGTSIGIRLNDRTNYYNVYVDGSFRGVFHGTRPGAADYMLASGLENTRHTLRFSRRNITFDEIYTFDGFLLDSGATLLPPAPKPERKMEFIGDSFTAAESNEAHAPSLPWEERFPVTNIDEGFAAIIARHFDAQYTTTCRSGGGMFCDWQGDRNQTLPLRFDRTFMDSAEPKWNFSRWVPNVVVICLGLNDFSGLKDSTGHVSDANSELFQKAYHNFIAVVRSVYPHVKIVAVAAYPEWIRENVKEVVKGEEKEGDENVFYATFDEFPGGYVANGHPTVQTHHLMADQLIRQMEKLTLFSSDEER